MGIFGPDLGGGAGTMFSLSNPQSFYNNNSAQSLPGMDPYATLANYGMGNSINPTNNNGGGFFNSGTMQGITQGLGAFQSLASLYGMFQNLGLQKKAFKFARQGTKRNFNASATAFNNAVSSKETARRAYAEANGQDYDSMYAYGTGEKVEKWT